MKTDGIWPANDLALNATLDAAVARLYERAQLTMPGSASQLIEWVETVHDAPPGVCFRQSQTFPMLLLPWFLEHAAGEEGGGDFSTDVMYSTMNLYFFLRFIDNIVDRETDEVGLLPAIAFFHHEAQATYRKHFDEADTFWNFFEQCWLHCADVTVQDVQLGAVTRETFCAIAAQKTSAVKIPLAAVCHHYNRVDLLDGWTRFHDLLGCWHQMWNDLRDWDKDQRLEISTYFLSEGTLRKGEAETLAGWVIREGYRWGLTVLDDWMVEMSDLAHELNSPRLVQYLRQRRALENRRGADVLAGLENAGQLATLLGE